MAEHTVYAVDLAKSVFEIAVSKRPGKVAEQHRVTRARFMRFFGERRPETVLMEACGSAHHWGRSLEELGYQAVLLPPADTRRYVRRSKTDRADSRALLEAFRNEDIRPVPVKTIEQQTLTSLHRLRSAWLAARTARINTLRGLLRELGLTIPVGARHVLPRVRALLGDPETGIPPSLHPVLAELCQEITELQQRVRMSEEQLERLARQTPVVERLRSVPGIGLLTATALVAFVGNVRRFPSGRHFASYLGLTPREHSSGSTRRMGRISKQGDRYLRTLLIHGARAILWSAKRHPRPIPLLAWALKLECSHGHNKAVVALANKLARIAWAVWKQERSFEPRAA